MTSNIYALQIMQDTILPMSGSLLTVIPDKRPDHGQAVTFRRLSETGKIHEQAVKDAARFIRENFTRQITIAEIAATVYMSTYHFCRIFKKYTNYAPHQYLLQVRLQRAAFLLAHSDRTITHICHLSGFRRASHFSAMFAKSYDISPTVYREQAWAKARPRRQGSPSSDDPIGL